MRVWCGRAPNRRAVTACFARPAGHPVTALLNELGLEAEDEVVVRRVLTKDGRSRAFINDQPVGIALLRRAAALLVEVQGQHEQIGLADAASHAGLLDAFGVPRPLREATAAAWRDWREAIAALEAAREAIAAAQRDEEWLRHAVDELAALAPQRWRGGAARAGTAASAAGRASCRGDRGGARRAGAARSAQCRARGGAACRVPRVAATGLADPEGCGQSGRPGARCAGARGGGAGRSGKLPDAARA